MSDIRSQVVSLYNTLHAAVKVDPKALVSSATKTLIRQLAQRAKADAGTKDAAEMVEAALSTVPLEPITVSDAFNLVGQLMKASARRDED